MDEQTKIVITSNPLLWTEFGDQLRHWRRRASLSQTQVGARVGYHHSVISKLESGTRKPSSRLVRKLDEVLETGGRLARIFEVGGGPRWQPPDDGSDPSGLGWLSPLPEEVVGWDAAAWPSRLPCQGLSCPLHGAAGCEVPTADDAFELYAAFKAGRAGAGSDTVHVLTALLATYARAAEEQTSAWIAAAVESALRALVRSLRPAAGGPSRALLQLAATYAALAGEQRMMRGQLGAAMAWYGKGLHWATAADDVVMRVTLLCDMSTMSRLEYDARNALGYARAMRAMRHERPWVSTLAHLYEARGEALLGDYESTERSVDLARDGLGRLGERDALEAPWMSGRSGQVLVESGACAALRDIAAATADRVVAKSAIRAAEDSLAHLPTQMRPFHLLMTLRLADSYACAGEAETAVAVASPVVAEAGEVATACIRQEMRGLRSRLMARWGEQPAIRDFVDRTAGYTA